MTRELARAVRCICGYNTNLRKELPASYNNPTCYERAIARLIFDNLLGIYGLGIYNKLGTVPNPQPGVDCEDYMKVWRFVQEEARKACICQFDDA